MASLDKAYDMLQPTTLHHSSFQTPKQFLFPFFYEFKCTRCGNMNVTAIINDGGSIQHCPKCNINYRAKKIYQNSRQQIRKDPGRTPPMTYSISPQKIPVSLYLNSCWT